MKKRRVNSKDKIETVDLSEDEARRSHTTVINNEMFGVSFETSLYTPLKFILAAINRFARSI